MKTMTILTIALLFWGCAVDTAYWFQRAQHEDTIDEYKHFLAKYPDSPEAPKAIRRLEELEYIKAKQDGQYSKLEKFLHMYPSSSFRENVKSLMSSFELINIEKDSLFYFQMFGLKQDPLPNCICRVSSSIALSSEPDEYGMRNNEAEKAYYALLIKRDAKGNPISNFYSNRQIIQPAKAPEFSWYLYPQGENDFLSLEKGVLNSFNPSILTIETPTTFHSKRNVRVFTTHSDWVLGVFSLISISGTTSFEFRGNVGDLNGRETSINCDSMQVLGTILFPKDTWIPFYKGTEFKNGGIKYDSTGITVLKGTEMRLKK